MPGKTNTDLIRELDGLVKTLHERSLNDRRDIARLEASNDRLKEVVDELKTSQAVQISMLDALKTVRDEKDRRRWMVWMAVIASILSLIVNIVLTVWKR